MSLADQAPLSPEQAVLYRRAQHYWSRAAEAWQEFLASGPPGRFTMSEEELKQAESQFKVKRLRRVKGPDDSPWDW